MKDEDEKEVEVDTPAETPAALLWRLAATVQDGDTVLVCIHRQRRRLSATEWTGCMPAAHGLAVHAASRLDASYADTDEELTDGG